MTPETFCEQPNHDMPPDTDGLPHGWTLVRMSQIAEHRPNQRDALPTIGRYRKLSIRLDLG